MSNNSPLVSVVIPLYNKARHIERAVQSVTSQTHSNTEIIVVDDGSTDGGGDIARSISDPRVKVLSGPNCGVSSARNKGINSANAELVAFLDADDEWLPDFLETVLDLRSRFPEAGMYATGYSLSSKTNRWSTDCLAYAMEYLEGGLLRDYFLLGCTAGPIISSNVMVPKNILQEVKGFPIELMRTEDLVVWMRIALKYPVAWSCTPLVIWHEDADNRTVDSFTNGLGEPTLAQILDDYLDCGKQPICPVESIREYITKYNLFFAMHNWIGGDTRLARKLLMDSKGTKVFHKKWVALNLLVSAPRHLGIFVWKLNEMLHGRNPALGKCGDIRIHKVDAQACEAIEDDD